MCMSESVTVYVYCVSYAAMIITGITAAPKGKDRPILEMLVIVIS